MQRKRISPAQRAILDALAVYGPQPAYAFTDLFATDPLNRVAADPTADPAPAHAKRTEARKAAKRALRRLEANGLVRLWYADGGERQGDPSRFGWRAAPGNQRQPVLWAALI